MDALQIAYTINGQHLASRPADDRGLGYEDALYKLTNRLAEKLPESERAAFVAASHRGYLGESRAA